MDLRDYPRPKNDTGIGVHWSAGFPAAIGLGQIEQLWLPELRAMGIKWVKLTRHDGGLELSELLLKNDIMPIVRLYRFQPNPGTLDAATLAAVKDYVAAGVRYFEFNNEPDLGVEWQGNFVPPNAVEIVARNAILDIEAILAAGGYPGIPALATGTKWDLVGEICRQNRRDLLAEPVWQAIHNYGLNHPLDYPYDTSNQQGVPVAQDFYDRLAGERWDGDAWAGWSLERVNLERQGHANPGATAFDDPSCWRAYERYDKLIRDQIGRSLPILATEDGYVVGQRPDPRYPAITPQLHMAYTLEACRVMMGTSSRFDHAPDYFFCTAFWLLGNYSLGSWSPNWEGQAWYSSRWSDGRLPVIAALKAEPQHARAWRGDAGLAGRVGGIVGSGAGLTAQLQHADGWSATARVDAAERYEFRDVPLGSYRVSIIEAAREQDVTLTRERPAATANFDVSDINVIARASVVQGVVRNGAGQTVRLSRPADGWTQDQTVAPDGAYGFQALQAGIYTVTLVGADVAPTSVTLDGANTVKLDLAAPGWGWQATDGGASPGFGVIRCRIQGRQDYPLHLWAAGWEGMTLRTGSKPEYGADACEFAPLGAGDYSLQPEGVATVAEARVDGRRVIWITFTEHAAPAARAGLITGVVAGGGGRTVRLLRPPAGEPVAQTQAATDGSYRFDKLAPGSYTVQVLAGGPDTAIAAQKTHITVEGTGPVQVDLTAPGQEPARMRWTVEDGGGGPGFAVVRCRVVDQPGRTVSLRTWGWGGITQVTGSKPEYGPDACEFAPLGPGTYFVELEEPASAGDSPQTTRAEVNLAPNRVVWVRFERTEAGGTPEPELPSEPPEPPSVSAASIIAGTVTNGDGLLVLLTGPLGEAQATVTAGRYRFEGLPAGAYRVAVLAADPTLGELAVQEGLMADGVHPLTLDFDLPATTRAESRVTGRVRGGAGRIIVLTGPHADGAVEPVATHTTTIGPDETYSFTDLAAGAYSATVRDTDPPSGSTQTQGGILLDGVATVRVDFDLAALGPVKTLDHYLLVGVLARSRDDFLALLRYTARFRPVVGSDEAEARKARHVTLLGGVNAVSALAEQGLRMSGCQVQRIETDFAENIGKLLDEGRAY